MLTNQDKTWLSREHPGLKIDKEKISGEIEITATYSEQSGRFLHITPDTIDGVGGVRLSGKFKIGIEKRDDTSHSRLPALSVEGVDYISDRHFNQTDFSGCVCNPLEEDEFLEPAFAFQRYMQELVIPFLYGQLFFTEKKRWPWSEYAHGGVGLLEAYSKNPTFLKTEECIQKMSRELVLWRKVKPLLLQKTRIKGHIPCLCPRHDHMRRCHGDALKGLRLLRESVKNHNFQLP